MEVDWPTCERCDLKAIVVGGEDDLYPACWFHGLDALIYVADDGKPRAEEPYLVPWLTFDEDE